MPDPGPPLPALVPTFHATLGELEDAHLLLHVIDGSGPNFEQRFEEVGKLLAERDLPEIPHLVVFGKPASLPEQEVAALCKRCGASRSAPS